jgi:hypothetical protein
MARLVDPILADLQAEHCDAIMRGARWGCGLAWFRAILALARAGAVHALVVRPWEERRHVGRALAVAIVAFVGVAALLSAPFTLYSETSWPRLIYFLAYGVPVALPAGLVCGVIFGLREARHRLRAWILAIALLGSVGSLWFMAVVVPASSRALQEVFQAEPARLRPVRVAPPGPVSVTLMRMHPGAVRIFRAESRLALACAPLVLVSFILCVASGRRWTDAGIAVAISVGYFGSLRWADLVYESQLAKAWAPNSIVLGLTTGSLLLRWERARRRSGTRVRTRLVAAQRVDDVAGVEP